jgi:nitroreductase
LPRRRVLGFCADFNRHLQICPEAELGLAEQLLLGVVIPR